MTAWGLGNKELDMEELEMEELGDKWIDEDELAAEEVWLQAEALLSEVTSASKASSEGREKGTCGDIIDDLKIRYLVEI